jgi:hypothetical protein
MGKITQEQRVLDYMRRFGSITTLDANRDLGVTRLSAKIFNLRKAGYEIPGETIEVKNRFGETTHVTKYMLAEEKFIQENENHIPRLD